MKLCAAKILMVCMPLAYASPLRPLRVQSKDAGTKTFLRSQVLHKLKEPADASLKKDIETSVADLQKLESLNITDIEGRPITLSAKAGKEKAAERPADALERAADAVEEPKKVFKVSGHPGLGIEESEESEELEESAAESNEEPAIQEPIEASTNGTVLYGDDPLQAFSAINTNITAEAGDDDEDLEDSEDPEEIDEDYDTNSTDEWAFEKAHDDGELLYGTNPLEAVDDDDDEQEFIDTAVPDTNSTDQGSYDEEHDEEHDNGEVFYGTNPLEHEEESVEDPVDEKDPYAHLHILANADTNSTDEFAYEREHDDGTMLYGTNPLESEEYEEDADDGYDEASEELQDQEEEEGEEDPYEHDEQDDNDLVLYGTNPLEEKKTETEDEDDPSYVNAAEDDFHYSEEHHEDEPEYSGMVNGTNPIDEPDSSDDEMAM